jgi:hypothetical protein
VGVKGTAPQFDGSVSKERLRVHFIAMAEMVVNTAQIQEIRQRHPVLSSSNETQDQPHLSQVTIKSASEQIHREMLALELIPHLWTILQMRAVI